MNTFVLKKGEAAVNVPEADKLQTFHGYFPYMFLVQHNTLEKGKQIILFEHVVKRTFFTRKVKEEHLGQKVYIVVDEDWVSDGSKNISASKLLDEIDWFAPNESIKKIEATEPLEREMAIEKLVSEKTKFLHFVVWYGEHGWGEIKRHGENSLTKSAKITDVAYDSNHFKSLFSGDREMSLSNEARIFAFLTRNGWICIKLCYPHITRGRAGEHADYVLFISIDSKEIVATIKHDPTILLELYQRLFPTIFKEKDGDKQRINMSKSIWQI